MKIFLILLLVFSWAKAQTNVSGNQSGIWSKNNSPYRIIGDVTILSGDSLKIEPGVEINFNGSYRILVQGTMLAEGTIQDSIIFKHQTSGQYHYGIDIDQSTDISRFKYCRIQDGEAMDVGTSYPYNRFGGGIFIYKSDTEIINCTFKNNRAWYGGAINGRYACSPIIQANLLINNTAARFGGAICAYGGSGSNVNRMKIIDNIIVNNKRPQSAFTTDGGGGITLYRQTDVEIINNTIVNNYSYGHGGGLLFITSETDSNEITKANIINTIFWDNVQTYTSNTGSDQIDTIRIKGSTDFSVTYCDIEDGFTGIGNISNYPDFVDSSSTNYHLFVGSSCIDAGTSSGAPSVDADSNATNQDGNNSSTNEYDIGAFEFLQEVQTLSSSTQTNYLLNTFEGSSRTVASITLTGYSSGSGEITVNCFTKSEPLNAPDGSKSILRWYRISETGNLSYSSADLRLYFSADENLDNLSAGNLTLWHRNGNSWINMPGTVTSGSNYVQLAGVSQVNLSGDWAFSDPSDNPLPVALISFKANIVDDKVELSWETASEIENLGFNVLRRGYSGEKYNIIASYLNDTTLCGLGNSSIGTNYVFVDENIQEGKNYSYKLCSVDYSGIKNYYPEINIKSLEELNFFISNNYPNPFNPQTSFNIIINEKSNVILEVYNTLGQKLFVLNKEIEPGKHRLLWNASARPSGIYFYRIKVNNKLIKSGKMILLK